MICDLASDELPDIVETDVCIVGAGPAGITAALTLARRNVDVVVLESGGRTVEPDIQDLNRSEIVGRPHIGIHEGRYRALGGTSTRWGGQILPLFPIDFAQRSWVKLSGWPISPEEIQSYADHALSFEGLDKCLTDDTAVWRTIGFAAPNVGDQLDSFLTRWCPEPDFSRIHGAEIARLPNLRCVLHATVTALAIHGRRIDLAISKSLSGKSLKVRARRFLFCVGTIETARLLLQRLADGAVPPWAGPGNVIGHFFQDHPGVTCADVIPGDPRLMPQLFDLIYHRGLKYQPRIMLNAARQTQLRSLNAGGTVIAQTRHDDVLQRTKASARELARGRPTYKNIACFAAGAVTIAPFLAKWAWRSVVSRRAFNPRDRGFRLGAQIEQPPRSESRVSLSSSLDAFGLPRAKLDWRVGAEEVEAVANFAETVKAEFEKAGMAEIRIDDDVASRSARVLTRVVDQSHHMGTARMSQSAEGGVVDKNLKMFHTDNGYICSGAVFPTSSFSNPTHTLIALAVRVGEHLHSTRG